MNNFNWQGRLKAGANVAIKDGIISASGGGGGGDVTTDTNQTITGIKTFSNGLNANLLEINGQPIKIKNSAGTGSAYLQVEQVYKSGYKNWFGLNFIRTTGSTQNTLVVMEVRQDDYLYIVSNTGLKLYSNSIELYGNTYINNVLSMEGNRIQRLGTPTADADAATKKYVDDAIAAAIKP